MEIKVENEVTLSREEIADWLTDLADALREDGSAQLPLVGPVVTLALSDEMHVEIEAHIDGDDVELELELSWSTGQKRRSGSQDETQDVEEADTESSSGEAGTVASGGGQDERPARDRPGNGSRSPKEGATGETRATASSGVSSGSAPASAAKGRPKASTTGQASTTNGADASPAASRRKLDASRL